MLADLIEVAGLVLTILGGIARYQHPKGARRWMAILPFALFLASEAMPPLLVPRLPFAKVYPCSLVVDVIAAALGLLFACKHSEAKRELVVD